MVKGRCRDVRPTLLKEEGAKLKDGYKERERGLNLQGKREREREMERRG